MNTKELTGIYLEAKIIDFADNKKYKWASGMMSPVYCDHRKMLGQPQYRKILMDQFSAFCSEVRADVDAVVGVATGGIPYAAWVAEKLDLPLGYIRPQAKTHGSGNRVEGGLARGARVLLIEDMISTGGSSLQVVKSLKAEGFLVPHTRALMTYFHKYVVEKFSAEDSQMKAMLEFSTFLGEPIVRSTIEAHPAMYAEWEEELKKRCLSDEAPVRGGTPGAGQGPRLVLKKPQ